MGTEITLDPTLPRSIHVANSELEAWALKPKKVFCDAEFLVIDDLDWDVDFGPIQKSLSPDRRKFEEAFNDGDPSKSALRQIKRIEWRVHHLFNTLYPGYEGKRFAKAGWRNQPTGPEPLHLDSYDPKGAAGIGVFVNVSAEPRRYRVGWKLEALCHMKQQRQMIRDIWHTAQSLSAYPPSHFSVVLRRRWIDKEAPFDEEIPAHEVSFAPGSIWFWNPKLILHQVIHGTGALSMSWMVTNSGCILQAQILRGLN